MTRWRQRERSESENTPTVLRPTDAMILPFGSLVGISPFDKPDRVWIGVGKTAQHMLLDGRAVYRPADQGALDPSESGQTTDGIERPCRPQLGALVKILSRQGFSN